MSSSIQDLASLNRKANELDRLTKGLQRTINQLGDLSKVTVEQQQQNGQSGERKFLTHSQVMKIRSKLLEFRQLFIDYERKIDTQNKTIKTLKATFKKELLTIKNEIISHSLKSTPNDFRDIIEKYLLDIRNEVNELQKENDELRQQNSKLKCHPSQTTVPLSEVQAALENAKQIRIDYIAEQKEMQAQREKIRDKALEVQKEVQEIEAKYDELEKKCKSYEKQISKYRNNIIIPRSEQIEMKSRLSMLRDELFDLETENKSLRMDNLQLKEQIDTNDNKVSLRFSPEYEINHSLFLTTIDMHTGGEPLRIIDTIKYGGIPLDFDPKTKNLTLLEKRKYMKDKLDHFRKLLMLEPRGHCGMYGAIIVRPDNNELADFAVLFMHNEGYSTMCGHAVIALARYAIDSNMIENNNKEEEKDSNDKNSKLVRIQTPCGIVRAQVEIGSNGQTTGNVSFLSAPGWAEQLNQSVEIDKIGSVTYDIGFGGAYYAILPAKSIGLSVTKSSVKELINGGTMISNKVKEILEDKKKLTPHPDGKTMEFLYGTILTDENDNDSESGNSSNDNNVSNNITIFADRQVDRCPTGSGVIARLAVDNAKNLVKLNEKRQYIGPTGSVFDGCIKEVNVSYKSKNGNCVRVQVSGSAFYSGTNKFYLEKNDSLGKGFLLR